MPQEQSEPSSTDTGYFTDSDDLTEFMQDIRISDSRALSSFEDAQAVISTFAESSDSGAWPTLDRASVAERLGTLFSAPAPGDSGTGYRSIYQAGLNLCGPAALLVMATGRDPVAVARYATDLFNTGSGSIGNFSVSASDDFRNADFAEMSSRGSTSSQAEWMMLGAIRNDTEQFWQPEWTGNPDQEVAGMTRPEELANWMQQTGIWSRVIDSGRWASNPGIPNATSLKPFEGTDIAMLIHAKLLDKSEVIGRIEGPAATSWSPLDYFPNHWVVLLSEVTQNVVDNTLEFTVWTWGSRARLRASQQVFIDNYFGTVVASL
jgi:hypothetical protein